MFQKAESRNWLYNRQLFPEGPRIYYRSHFFQTDGGV